MNGQSTREYCIGLARRAGDFVRTFQRRGLRPDQIHTKQGEFDLVTEADIGSERLIVDGLRARFPDHIIYAEESAVEGPPSVDWLWLIDPIDGTTNYAHGLPLYAVNLALAHHGEPVLAVTHEPASDRIFWAEKGGGAWLREDGQDRRLRVSETATLGRSLLATGFPYDRATNPDNNLAEFAALEVRVHAVRRLGASALHIAWVAAGLLDGYWEQRLKPWDWVAGSLLVREAGGLVTDYDGRPWSLGCANMIATNGQPGIHLGIQQGIAGARASLGLPRTSTRSASPAPDPRIVSGAR